MHEMNQPTDLNMKQLKKTAGITPEPTMKPSVTFAGGIATAAVFALAMVGCTKQRPYEPVLKEKVYSKADFPSDGTYIFYSLSGDTTRTAQVAAPYQAGDARIVKFSYGEKSLDVVEVEPDPRFRDNATNAKTVLSIPAEYIDYRCTQNSVGECSNKEEVDTYKGTDARKFMKLDFGSLKMVAPSSLPADYENIFSAGKCYPEQGAKLLDVKMDGNSINIAVERTFSTDVSCTTSSLQTLSDLNFSVIYHYSMVKLDTVASPDYKTVAYPVDDQNTFGFFTTQDNRLSVDNADELSGQQTFLNRWNPTRKVIDYYLTDNFNKPGMESVKQGSYEAVSAINNAFSSAGVDLKVVLHEPAGKDPGDLRNSMIVMVEDPINIGLLGYGPTLANPQTGEILSGRVMMYLGVIKETVRDTYNEIIIERQQAAVQATTGANSSAVGNASHLSTAGAMLSQFVQASLNSANSALRVTDASMAAKPRPSLTGKTSSPAKVVAKVSAFNRVGPQLTADPVKDRILSARDLMFRMDARNFRAQAKDLKSRTQQMSLNCQYPIENIDFKGVISPYISNEIPAGQLKPWDDLTDTQKQFIMDKIVPYVWVPTLVHELGHNMGLRHNFKGSEDKDNFYTTDELAKMGINHPVVYSSVMDYAGRTLNELHTMGKYDIAAFRFGYRREVEAIDPAQPESVKILKVPTVLADTQTANPTLSFKDYGYCTDESVELNARCKRFDEGTNSVEIVKFLIKQYEDFYARRNFRNTHRSFSLYGMDGYASRVYDTFYQIRMFQKQADRLRLAGIPARIADPKTTPEALVIYKRMWNDAVQAAQIAGDFLLGVVVLPDRTCLIDSKDSPGTQIAVETMANFASGITSCFDPVIKQYEEKRGMVVLAEGGKFVKSFKASSNTNPYVDQIDVRGTWIDKIIAADMLARRTFGQLSLDDSYGNFFDADLFGNFGQQIAGQYQGMLKNDLQNSVTFRTEAGEEIPVNLSYSFDVDTAQLIRADDSDGLAEQLGMSTKGDTFLNRELIHKVETHLPYATGDSSQDAMLRSFEISENLPNGLNPADFAQINLSGHVLWASKTANTAATEAIGNLQAVRILDKIRPELLATLMPANAAATVVSVATSAPTPGPSPGPSPTPTPLSEAGPVFADDAEKAAYGEAKTLKPGVVQKFLDERFQPESYYEQLLLHMLNRT